MDLAPLQRFLDNPLLAPPPLDPFMFPPFPPHLLPFFRQQWIHCLELLGFSHRDCSSTELPVSLPGMCRSQGKQETGKKQQQQQQKLVKIKRKGESAFAGIWWCFDEFGLTQHLPPAHPSRTSHCTPDLDLGAMDSFDTEENELRAAGTRLSPSQLSSHHPLGIPVPAGLWIYPKQAVALGQ